jgi:hypothetical protein
MSSDPRHASAPPPPDDDPKIDPSAVPPMPPPPNVPVTASVAELRQLLIEFSTSMYRSVAAIPGALRSLDSRTGLLRRLLVAFLVTLVLDIGLTIVVGFFVHNQGQTQDQLHAAVGKLDRVIKGNCYVLGLVLPNYHPGSAPQRANYPGGAAAYDNLYVGMQGWSDELGCGIKHTVPGT